MEVFEQLKQVIKQNGKQRIVFPEGGDPRILTAVSRLKQDGLVEPIVLGEQAAVSALAEANGLDLTGVEVVDYLHGADFEEMVQKFHERMAGGKHFQTMEEAEAALHDANFYGTMMVYTGQADGMVSGAAHSTADTVRPALFILKTKPGMHRISGAFIMERGEEKYVFADCAISIDPTSDQLAEFAAQSAATAKMIGIDPKVAFLSFSTHGSAKGPQVDKVAEAAKMFKEQHADIPADGELQFDAAFVPAVAKLKAPDSAVAGSANVFVFPELQSGNISYKIAQRLGNFTAIGPVLQGIAKPVNDLSRGCSADDVYKIGILTAAQAIMEG
ncbi:phosphate acetyltransferase [Lactobacillus nasalidis]|uniref:Phosphate acetyltransferase n=1 Tax=Lactobacillus nasalidis TaxID=2797258 RepID=A0ABQ3W866_9LACO|nr:phosphate acetyltransferase [Lactobacillus nasalidis]GHV98317.1 phosphate acetyltransferase [Lactobacillus nasalidis]GHV98675.1 phosphate acetyltransferase [Lactobacillus nasalidis]GHW00382.1 phosphate acetyltransferase [Lactobacillus nasalidis]